MNFGFVDGRIIVYPPGFSDNRIAGTNGYFASGPLGMKNAKKNYTRIQGVAERYGRTSNRIRKK